MADRIPVEVVYALRERQRLIALEVAAGATATEAVVQSGILEEFPELDIDALTLGVFGRRVTPGHVLQPRDRVEIYRPLQADPKEVRRQLAAQGKTMGSKR